MSECALCKTESHGRPQHHWRSMSKCALCKTGSHGRPQHHWRSMSKCALCKTGSHGRPQHHWRSMSECALCKAGSHGRPQHHWRSVSKCALCRTGGHRRPQHHWRSMSECALSKTGVAFIMQGLDKLVKVYRMKVRGQPGVPHHSREGELGQSAQNVGQRSREITWGPISCEGWRIRSKCTEWGDALCNG